MSVNYINYIILEKFVIPYSKFYNILWKLLGIIILFYSIFTPPFNDSLPNFIFGILRKDFCYHFIAFFGITIVY